MNPFIKNLITLGLRYLMLWLMSNEKNHQDCERKHGN